MMFNTDDWLWWNWLLFISSCLITTVVGTWHLRKHEEKKSKFRMMDVTVDNTVDLIDWTIDRAAMRFVRNLAAVFGFVFGCMWAWKAVFS